MVSGVPERVHTKLAAVSERVSRKEPLQSHLQDVQVAPSPIEARWRLICEHNIATEFHLAQFAQQPIMLSSQVGTRKMSLKGF